MRLLLDTHVFLWALVGSRKLSRRCRDDLVDPGNVVLVSAASIWEIAIKASIGKLKLKTEHAGRLAELIVECGFEELPVTARHASVVRTMPMHHADPFDRLLVAQAQVEGLTLATADPAIRSYSVATLAAGVPDR